MASILASTWNEYIGKDEHVGLQDTNDRFLANMQRDGSYSVVPRVPGGEITPDQLIALGEVAKRFGLYTKITGAQRVDLFGARVDQLPPIWRELIAAGFESGHAYGKALRTVKSCVGSTWCRYGVQDSVSMAVDLENRYKGLRSPHKLKGAASGCARECAEAQSKDFGVIATEQGYNLYVCGNGGMKPQHAQLLASDLDEATVIRYLDRFLMFYVRTADRLERTATWFNKLEGGIEYLRRVIVEDALGIGAELERDMQQVVDTYQCEWTDDHRRSGEAQALPTVRQQRRRRSQHRPRAAAPPAPARPLEREGRAGEGGDLMLSGSAVPLSDLAAEARMADLRARRHPPRHGGRAPCWAASRWRSSGWAPTRSTPSSNFDPFSKAFVLSRGIVGDRAGVPKVASPIFKQSFDLRTGRCLDDPAVAVRVYPVRLRERPGRGLARGSRERAGALRPAWTTSWPEAARAAPILRSPRLKLAAPPTRARGPTCCRRCCASSRT